MASRHRLVAMWMFGHVHCVLTFGVRILGEDGQTYVALRHQVHHEILQQISAMQAAPGHPFLGLPVAFQVDHRPSCLEDLQMARAKMVMPQTLATDHAIQATISDEDSESLSRLRRGLEEAIAANNGLRLCELILCCLAALAAWESPLRRCRAANGYAELATAAAARLQLEKEVQSCLRPTALACRKSLEENLAASELSIEPWCKLRSWLDLVLAPPAPVPKPRVAVPARRHSCDVEGCGRQAGRMKLLPDATGPAGWRCDRHGGRLPCNVQGCAETSVGRVEGDDALGLAGHRCYLHGGRRCEVCKLRAVAGERQRCSLHALHAPSVPSSAPSKPTGNRCNVADCTRMGWGGVEAADDLGPAGKRCFKHGGQTCSVSGCQRRPARHVREQDHWGPAGVRCKTHCLQNSGPRNRVPARGRRSSETPPQPGMKCRRLDAKGWRCKQLAQPGSTVCAYHHLNWLQPYFQKKKLARKRLRELRVAQVSDDVTSKSLAATDGQQ